MKDTPIHSEASLISGRRLVRNVFWNFGGEIGRALSGLIGTPILIAALGAPKFGLLVLLWAAMGCFGLFDLGMSVTITKLTAGRIGQGRDEEVPDLVWTATLTTIVLGTFGGIALWAGSSWLVGWAFKLSPDLAAEALTSLHLLAITAPVLISFGVLLGVFAAFQRFDLIGTMRGPGELISYLPMFAVLPFSRSVVPLIAVMLIGHGARLAVCLYLIFRIVPGLAGRPRFRFAALRELFSFSGWVAIFQALGFCLGTCDRFFIGALISVEAVAFYAPALSLVRKIRMVPSLVSGVMLPAFSQGLAEDREKTARLFERTEKFIFLLVFPISLLTVIFAKPVMTLWLGTGIGLRGTPILRWLALGAFASCLAEMPSSMLLAWHRPDVNAKWLASMSVLSLPLMWWLTSVYGAEGTAIARAGGMIAGALFLFTSISRVIPAIAQAIRHFAWLLVAAMVALACGALPMSMLGDVVYALAVLVAFGTYCWFWVFSIDERRIVIGALSIALSSEAV